MYKSKDELIEILGEMIKNAENECVEFKSAKNNFDIDKLGKYFSALSNEATLRNKQYSWMVFGIDDKTHAYTNTKFCFNDNFNGIKKQISDNTTDNITFIEIYSFVIENNRIIMFQIPAASGTPVNWKGYPYGRTGESLMPLSLNKIEQIKATANYDWSRNIIHNATIDDLDSNAILEARKQFKIKHKNKPLADEVDNWTDDEFLNKARLTIDGKITNTALLLLGKTERDVLFSDYTPRMTWKLCNDNNIIDYEHFSIPYLINVENLKSKIRILRYRYMINELTLFPNEVDQYDNYTLRELINNAIVHQDYRLKGYINLMEYQDRLILINEGRFIPENIETVLSNGYSSPYYRNQFLANAMVNLNMIDTVGSGIKRVYNLQKEKYFPMPDYDLSIDGRVKVTLYGKIIDEKYSKILFEKTNLNIIQVMLLDKVQKNMLISKEQSDYLKKDKLVEGRYPKIYIASKIAEITDEKSQYIKNKGFDNKYYKDMIVDYIKEFKKANRNDIRNLLFDKLPSILTDKQKEGKIKNLLTSLRIEGVITTDSENPQKSNWILKK